MNLRTSSTTRNLIYNYVSLDIEFLGLPKECMNAPVIIETDVLNREGVIYIINKSGQRLVHDRKYSEVSAIDSVKKGTIKTSLSGSDLTERNNILDQYSSYMISSMATSTVTTGIMQILITNDTPISYRSYITTHPLGNVLRQKTKDTIYYSGPLIQGYNTRIRVTLSNHICFVG